ncbi:hypothetical protein GCM10010219_58850 [Streptomyces netropsis]|nr:hypothetical protein GCM10010219_58850 [Streptomyces netropsis]
MGSPFRGRLPGRGASTGTYAGTGTQTLGSHTERPRYSAEYRGRLFRACKALTWAIAVAPL